MITTSDAHIILQAQRIAVLAECASGVSNETDVCLRIVPVEDERFDIFVTDLHLIKRNVPLVSLISTVTTLIETTRALLNGLADEPMEASDVARVLAGLEVAEPMPPVTGK